MRYPGLFAACLLLFSGCTLDGHKTASEPPRSAARPEWPIPSLPLPPPSQPPPPPTFEVTQNFDAMPPDELSAAADGMCQDAADYVAWKYSKADNIYRLTYLTKTLTLAEARMQRDRWHGRYRHDDVTHVRAAMTALRWFLLHKRD
jgi:hypothetical protein